jgi:hypothetical protein
MLRRYRNEETGELCVIELDFEEDTITITRGEGDDARVETIDDADESHEMPADALFEQLCDELSASHTEILPDDLLELVEQGHEVTLRGRLRRFYADHEYKQAQGKICAGLDCRVNFVASPVLGTFYEEFHDPQSGETVELIPISSKGVGEDYGYEDEQQWIGVDPSLEDGPVYELFTSGAYTEAYPNLDAFLADLHDRDG